MSEATDPRELESHFAFGKNWESYAGMVGEEQIRLASEGLDALFSGEVLEGKEVIDIGCGSGLHSLAFLRKGVKRLLAVDLDPASVATTERLLAAFGATGSYQVRQLSVFDLRPQDIGLQDIVYSWGVLHHTGGMVEAIRGAASLVRPGGLLALALYRRTLFCGLWTVEKKWYAQASPTAQKHARTLFKALLAVALALTGRSLAGYKKGYQVRGMDFDHDLHDWMGGYPYESISGADLDRLLVPLGFRLVRSSVRRDIGARLGFFGSGCDEFLFQRNPGAESAAA